MFAQISGHPGPAGLTLKTNHHTGGWLLILDKPWDVCGYHFLGVKRDGEQSQLIKAAGHLCTPTSRKPLCFLNARLQAQDLENSALSGQTF